MVGDMGKRLQVESKPGPSAQGLRSWGALPEPGSCSFNFYDVINYIHHKF